jgi:hypothetical protein
MAIFAQKALQDHRAIFQLSSKAYSRIGESGTAYRAMFGGRLFGE